MEKINIFWHRRDLRYHDNAGLYYALDSDLPVLPIFIFDTNILDELDDKDDARVTFIYEALEKIDSKYRERGSGLLVFHTTPEKAFEQLSKDYAINAVYTNRDYEPYAKERDMLVRDMLGKEGKPLHSFKDQVIFEQGEIVTGDGHPYKVFTPFKKSWLEKYQTVKHDQYTSELKLSGLYQGRISSMPTYKDIGFEKSSLEMPSDSIPDSVLDKYSEQRDYPAMEGTSRIGVHLRFGTVSIRALVVRAQAQSDVWLNELVWREFYMMVLAHFPEVVDRSFKPKYDNLDWENDENAFEKWCEGKTGFPIVDAGMRQLNQTGYMHNRVRMITASFLTKHLLIDWRWGERYFACKLLDYELSSNNGGWQWAAGTGTDAQPYFRVFNPHSQKEKYDPDETYIRQWVPEFGTEEYPEPIVDHKEARERAISRYKRVV